MWNGTDVFIAGKLSVFAIKLTVNSGIVVITCWFLVKKGLDLKPHTCKCIYFKPSSFKAN